MFSVPAVPKIKVISAADTPILLDDFVLAVAIMIGIIELLTRASVAHHEKIGFPPVAIVLVVFVFYKVMNLGVLALFIPWVGPDGLGRGVMLREGVLVLARTSAFVFVFILALNTLRSLESIRSALKSFLLIVMIVVGIALAQYFILDHRILTSTFRNIYTLGQIVPGVWGLEDPWFAGTGVGHEHLGAFMVLSLSILGGMLLCRWPIRRRQWLLLAFLFCACMFTLIYASSRGAWIGALFSFGAFVWLAQKRGKVSRLLLAVVGVLVLGAFVEFLLDSNAVDLVQSRVAKLPGVFGDEVHDDSARLRIGVFLVLWRIFEANFLVGLGPGGAGRIAEGQYIRELVEGGLIGGVYFVALLFVIGKNALKTLRLSRNSLVQGMSMGFFCGLVGLGAQMFFTELLILPKISVPFWLFAAVVYRLGYIERRQDRIPIRSTVQ